MDKEKRYTATYTIYLYAHNDHHARSKAKLIAERERIKYPNQDCTLEQLFETPLASFVRRAIPLDEAWDPVVKKFEDDDLPF
tara:strand:+ start:7361 stop:7606 length:246 start_codon:yes stop_codon:yes gene_type:complete